MAAITGRQRRGSEGGRKSKKKKCSSSKKKSEKSPRTHRTVYLHWSLMLFLLSVLPGWSSLTVTGRKGGNITLLCNYSNTQDLSIALTFWSKTAYGTGQDKYYELLEHKTGTCDLTLQDLKTTDAGKYNLKVYANGQLLSSNNYDICVDVNLTALIGEEVMFDDLPRDAESVEHLSNTGSIDVWRREQGVQTDRLMDKDGHLIIKNFRSRDAGTYRVLNSTGGVLVTVTLTEWSTASKYEQDSTRDDNTKDTERLHVWTCIAIGLVGALIALIVIRHQHLKRTKEHDSSLESAVQETVEEPRSPNDSNGYFSNEFTFSANRSAEDPVNTSFPTVSVD